MQVDFMLIGAQKCGTTTLAEQLAAHPQICFCQQKEPGYFNTTLNWQANLDAYHQLYTPVAGQLCGEGSTMYTFLPEWKETHRRLYAYNPNLKLIYIMRNPVERVISNYAHRLVRSTVKLPPEKAVFVDPVYLNRSRYGVQIRPYLSLFPRENVLLLIFEEYIIDQPATLSQIAKFLDIAPEGFASAHKQPLVTHRSVGEAHLPPTFQRLRELPVVDAFLEYVPESMRTVARQRIGKQLAAKPAFSLALRQLLWQFLEDDVCTVEQLLGRRLAVWRQGYTE